MSRRKAMLNIGSKSLSRNTPDRESSKNGSGLGLLSAYSQNIDSGYSHHDDSDSDDENVLPKSTLDSKVANFLKEIDDLDATIPSASKVKKKEKPKVEKPSESLNSNSNEFISWGPWQQCIDENTQHPYYWNTTTNEVTWTVPEEIAVQYQQITDNKQSSQKDKEKHKQLEKEQVNLKSIKSLQKNEKKQELANQRDEVAIPKKLNSKTEKIHSKIINASEATLEVDPPTGASSPKVNDIILKDEEIVPQKRPKLIEKDLKNVDPPSVRKRKLSNEDVEKKDEVVVEDVCKSDNVETQSTSTSEESCNEKSQIETDFNILASKFECLEAKKSSISPLHQLLIEVEIRLDDWKAGAVSLQYVKEKLEKVNERLAEYEKTVMPAGWLCHWDSRYNRYYYTNNHGRTQWDFPVVEKSTATSQNDSKTPSSSEPSQSTGASDAIAVATTSSTDGIANVDKSPPPQTDNKDTAAFPSGTFPPGMMNYNSFNMQSYYWNMQNFGVQFGGQFRPKGLNNSFPNSPMGPDHPLPPGDDAAPLPPTPEEEPPPPPPPPNEADEPISPPPPPPPPSDGGYSAPDEGVVEGDHGIEMEISDAEDDTSEQKPTEAENSPIAQLKGAPVDYSAAPQPPTTVTLPAPPPQLFAAASSLPPEKFKKIKKMKKDKAPLKKPPKQMFGMVAKWQKAKQEMEEEEERLILESEQELNQESNIQQRIEKWKMEQLQSGKAALNANFQPVNDDWKKRIKTRKNKVT